VWKLQTGRTQGFKGQPELMAVSDPHKAVVWVGILSQVESECKNGSK